MAELFVARATGIAGFEKLVALKQILPHLACNSEFLEMFLDEARLAATLHHPNIAQVYDIGCEGGSYFFTLEYVRGHDIRQIVLASRRARVDLPMAHMLAIIRGACAGLHYAHEKTDASGSSLNIVHRDVSPGNVLITYDGCVKIIDFGVAKAMSRQTETQSGIIKGKVSYMSPEQCRGEPLDRRSDVFALGILLYELTTRSRLFRGESEYATMRAVNKADVPPPRSRCPDYPHELQEIVLKALAGSREERYATAEALQLDLERFSRDRSLWVSTVELARYMREMFPEEWAACSAPESNLDPPRFTDAAPHDGSQGSAQTPTDSSGIRTQMSWRHHLPRSRRWPMAAAALTGGVASMLAFGVGTQPEPPPEPPPVTSEIIEDPVVPAVQLKGPRPAVEPPVPVAEATIAAETPPIPQGSEAIEEPMDIVIEDDLPQETVQPQISKSSEPPGPETQPTPPPPRTKKSRRTNKTRQRDRRTWDPDSALLPPG